MSHAVGIDLGSTAIYAMRTESGDAGTPVVVGGQVFLPEDLSPVVEFCTEASEVAIDAPRS
jgi:hypothetical protein